MENYIKNIEQDFKYALEHARKHEQLLKKARGFRRFWEGDIEVSFVNLMSSGYTGVTIRVNLSENQSIAKDVNLFMDQIGLGDLPMDEYPAGEWIRYTHTSENGAQLHLFFMYEKSKYCKLVETGEYTPVYKRVCE